ncbi:Mfa1 family fimbria major subunit [Prevotella copri]|uniref:Mfa1 family fimbria major subunit n=1 Tax=Segatella copri TaxID=165179 RepID=UPI001C37F8E8|nr:Mfa1 family fimbria major subunit [Segatella copri]MBV3444193.1 Mfa1 family fimbria major subunit [Segatella copri]
MKTKQLFFCSLTGLALLTTSCSSNDEALNGGNGASNDGNTYAQIAISVANSATTRADGNNTGDEVFGTDDEYTVNDLTVVLANENDIAMQVITPTLKTVSNKDEADKQVRVTEPFTCTPGKYKVYVLANYKNSQNSLSPIIKGSTDMKMVFGIGDITKLYTENNFFMTNVSAPEEKDIVEKATGKEVNDDGTEKTGGKNVNLVTVNVERAVSKVTFGNTADKLSFNIEEGGNIIAKAKLEGVSLINLNNKMFLVKGGTLAQNKPVTTNDWPYPVDPNYYKTKEDADYATYITDNFTQKEASSFSAPSDAKFYCPENTMSALAQLNGQTTGVVYKVNYKPEGKYYTELAAENGTDSYSQMFEKVLALGDDVRDAAITKTIFTTAEGTDGTNGTFYSYNGYVFKTKAGARLYKAIATNPGADAATVNTAFKNNESDDDIQTYAEGYCYYTAWIKHNPGGTTMQQDKYGVVRNFWYELTVNSIKKLGYSKPTFKDPKDPDDKAEASIQVQVNIKKWRWVKQNVDLE